MNDRVFTARKNTTKRKKRSVINYKKSRDGAQNMQNSSNINNLATDDMTNSSLEPSLENEMRLKEEVEYVMRVNSHPLDYDDKSPMSSIDNGKKKISELMKEFPDFP